MPVCCEPRVHLPVRCCQYTPRGVQDDTQFDLRQTLTGVCFGPAFRPLRIDAFDDILLRTLVVPVCSRKEITRSCLTDALTITQERGSGEHVGPLHSPPGPPAARVAHVAHAVRRTPVAEGAYGGRLQPRRGWAPGMMWRGGWKDDEGRKSRQRRRRGDETPALSQGDPRTGQNGIDLIVQHGACQQGDGRVEMWERSHDEVMRMRITPVSSVVDGRPERAAEQTSGTARTQARSGSSAWAGGRGRLLGEDSNL